MSTNSLHISVWGRTLEEYIKMFGLKELEPQSKIISIADGPSTFNKEMREQGYNVMSVDPIYNLNKEEIKEIFKVSYQFNKEMFYNNKERFLLENDEQIENLLKKRVNTFNSFIEDYELNRPNYKFGKFPEIIFNSESYDLCLSSNFLFIFDHTFDFDFHLKSINQMLNIAKEVRIFPIYDSDGHTSKHLQPIIESMQEAGHICEIRPNNYFVYKDGNRFLKIFKN